MVIKQRIKVCALTAIFYFLLFLNFGAPALALEDSANVDLHKQPYSAPAETIPSLSASRQNAFSSEKLPAKQIEERKEFKECALAQILPQKPEQKNTSASSLPDKRRFIDSRILRPNFSPPPERESKTLPSLPDNVFIPHFFDAHERLSRPNLSGISRLRFLTSADFYPFNYADAQGNISGYNIDLIRALCAELRLENICRIETAPWEQLAAKLQAGQAEAGIVGLAPAADNRLYLSFSRAYMRFPARFLARSGSAVMKNSAVFMKSGGSFADFLAERGRHLKIGAIRGTAHEKMAADYFSARLAGDKNIGGSSPQLIAYPNQAEMINALKADKIDLTFGDGMNFAMLLNAQNNAPLLIPAAAPVQPARPLKFIGGAYYGAGALGQGMRIATAQNNAKLTAAFNYALWQLERKGRLTELYLRYFPIGFY